MKHLDDEALKDLEKLVGLNGWPAILTAIAAGMRQDTRHHLHLTRADWSPESHERVRIVADMLDALAHTFELRHAPR